MVRRGRRPGRGGRRLGPRRGGDGGDELAAKVAAAIDAAHSFRHLYPLDMSVEDKIRTIVQEVYGADGVDFSVPALKRLAEIEERPGPDAGCMAKTQYSFSDDATRLGAPKGFTIHVRDLIPKTGAGFIVALTGAVMTMPGLPKVPAAMRMDVDDAGNPVGLPSSAQPPPPLRYHFAAIPGFDRPTDSATGGCG